MRVGLDVPIKIILGLIGFRFHISTSTDHYRCQVIGEILCQKETTHVCITRSRRSCDTSITAVGVLVDLNLPLGLVIHHISRILLAKENVPLVIKIMHNH